MSIMDKMSKTSQEVATSDFLLVEDDFATEYPGVFELLTRCKWKGKPRKPGRLVLYAEPGRATLVACEVDSQMVAFYSAEGFSEALAGLERALQAGSCDWRPDKRAKFRS